MMIIPTPSQQIPNVVGHIPIPPIVITRITDKYYYII